MTRRTSRAAEGGSFPSSAGAVRRHASNATVKWCWTLRRRGPHVRPCAGPSGARPQGARPRRPRRRHRHLRPASSAAERSGFHSAPPAFQGTAGAPETRRPSSHPTRHAPPQWPRGSGVAAALAPAGGRFRPGPGPHLKPRRWGPLPSSPRGRWHGPSPHGHVTASPCPHPAASGPGRATRSQ